MKIEAGKFYRTRDGRKARVYAVDGRGDYPIHGAYFYQGWSNCVWKQCGLHGGCEEYGDPYDLISEWVDKPVVDWSKMAAWHRWVAMDSYGMWNAYADEPGLGVIAWHSEKRCNSIPTAYAPTFSGDWKDSLVERPTV